jgi:hypothetical protein
MKRLQLLFRNLGLGDVISFSPLILLARDHGFAVDVAYQRFAVPQIAALLFGRHGEEHVRFGRADQFRGLRYHAAILFDRHLLPGFWLRPSAYDLLAMPVPERRRAQLLFYNAAVRAAMRLRGARARPLRASPGTSIGQLAFEDFAGYLGVAAQYSTHIPRVRALLRPAEEPPARQVVVHLFRDQSFKRLEPQTLSRVAQVLASAVTGAAEWLAVYDSASPFERQAAERVIQVFRSLNLRANLRGSPPLEEVVKLLASARLYAGVDHGISHLAGLLCPRSLVLYGGSQRHNDIHLLWRPLVEGEPVSHGPQVTSIESDTCRVALVHPAREEYSAQEAPDSRLINDVATAENLRRALGLLGFPAGPLPGARLAMR